MQKSNRTVWGAGVSTWKIVKSWLHLYILTPRPLRPWIDCVAGVGGMGWGVHQTSIKLGEPTMPCHIAYNLRLCLGSGPGQSRVFWVRSAFRPFKRERRHCLTAFSWYGFCSCCYCNLAIACLHIETFQRKGRTGLF